jgi:hypothetical protein
LLRNQLPGDTRKLRVATLPPRDPTSWARPQAAPVISVEEANWEIARNNPIRRLAFNLALAFIFLRFSMLHEVLQVVTGLDTHLITIVGYPVVLLTMLSGGVGRTLRGRPTRYWLGFTAWLLIAIPFSSWIGGSFFTVMAFMKVVLPVLFILAGLIVTWEDCRKMMFTVALGAMVNVTTARYFEKAGEARLALETGSIGNANDYVAHLLLVLPFVLFVLITPGRSWLTRVTCMATIAYGLYMASTAASRGGLVAFIVMCCFILTKASPGLRFGVAALVPILVMVILAVLPASIKERYATLFTSESQDKEALDSTIARTYLLKTSIAFTLEHPLFGVGPGEFLDMEGSTARKRGEHGNWQVPHNSYTQVSSEEGIPGLFFFVASSISAYLLLQNAYRITRGRPECRSINLAAFCVQISLVGFSCAILFLSLVYTFYLPALSGFAIAIQSIARREVSVLDSAARAASALPA